MTRTSGRTRRIRRTGTGRGAVAAALAVLVLVLAGCSGASSAQSAPTSGGLGIRGTHLQHPIAKPDLTLTDTAGQPYNLRTQTAGKITLLYFGYTHCPDVCPTTMADIALGLREVAVLHSKVDVVFVTTDPKRDTPAVIKTWLAHFDASFVGLTGNEKTIYAAADKVGVPLAPPDPKATGDYAVSHGAQVLAFSADAQARVVFSAGTSAEDYAHDLVLISENKTS